jgi:hypothetical protein
MNINGQLFIKKIMKNNHHGMVFPKHCHAEPENQDKKQTHDFKQKNNKERK